MKRRRFGRTELQVPVFSCGGMRFQQSWTAGSPVNPDSQRNLEATIDRALELGINHIETARGYGTSEAQVGQALSRIDRQRYLLQTKVAPKDDPQDFERCLDESFERLRVDRVDLFSFHGVNDETRLGILPPCYEIADRYRRMGRIGHIGFSTHANLSVIRQAIATDLFEYVNLHWYFILQENLPAIDDAARRDMGVFIISPSDKGGQLHTPRPSWVRDCAPLSPMQFNDLFCLAHPDVHTLSLGAARPSDFDEHVAILPTLDNAAAQVAPIVKRLQDRMDAAVGSDFAANHLRGVPEWEAVPGGVNIRKTLWLYTLAKAWDLLPFARMRYNMLSKDDHWFPGNKARELDAAVLRQTLADASFRDRIPAILRETHALLDEG